MNKLLHHFWLKTVFVSTESNISVGSHGNFEAELRLSRQNWNTLVNLPRQSFVTFSYKNNRLFSSCRNMYWFTEAEFKDPRQCTEAEFWLMLHPVSSFNFRPVKSFSSEKTSGIFLETRHASLSKASRRPRAPWNFVYEMLM